MEEILSISWRNEMFSRELDVNKCVSLKVLERHLCSICSLLCVVMSLAKAGGRKEKTSLIHFRKKCVLAGQKSIWK